MSNHDTQTSYDKVPYRSAPFPQTHPSRIGAIAQLFELDINIQDGFRLLELGCASGGNIIPLAQQYPQAHFVGIDASKVQIDLGNKVVKQTKLSNIDLLNTGIEDFASDVPFDFIICHGVYSWVPAHVQEAILRICQDNLSPQGLAYISYNTFPGWKMRGTIRDIMRYRSRSFETHEDQLGQARTFLEFLTKSLGEENSPYALMLRRELEAISKSDDYYLHHEHLEDTNQPVYFHEFMKQAQQFQMEYVCEADFGSSYIEKLPDNIKSMLVSVSHDRIELEQYLDFLRNRTFRQTILCHSSRKPTRQPQIDSLNRLYVSSNAIPEKQNYDYRSQDELLFRRRDARLKTTDPLVKVAFSILEKRWPQRVPFKELASVSRSIIHDRPIPIDNEFMTGETQRFAKTILDCFSSSLVDLHSDQSLCDSFPSDTPLAKPLQIQQANQSAMVTTLIHTEFQMDEFQRQLIQLCDGTKDRDQIVTAMVQLLENGKLTIYGNQGNKLEPSEDISETLKTYVNRTIDGLWKNGLLSSSK